MVLSPGCEQIVMWGFVCHFLVFDSRTRKLGRGVYYNMLLDLYCSPKWTSLLYATAPVGKSAYI